MTLRTPARARGPGPWIALAALSLLAGCAGARRASPAQDPGRRVFDLPGGGALEIAVPPGWTAGVSDGEGPATVVIRLERPESRFLALLTPYREPREGLDADARTGAARLIAEMARRRAAATSVEDDVPLVEMSAGPVRAFWFAATDQGLAGRDPGPDEWRHVVQGAFTVGRLLVGFALLDDSPGPQRDLVLGVVRGAREVGP